MVRNDAMAARMRRVGLRAGLALALSALGCANAAAQAPAASDPCFPAHAAQNTSAPATQTPSAPETAEKTESERAVEAERAAELAKWDAPKRPPDETKATRALRAMNQCFLELYGRAKIDERDQADALVVLHDSAASLFIDGKLVETKRILDGRYLDLRYSSHVPLAIFTILSRLPSGPIDAELTQRLTIYAGKIRDAKATIDNVAVFSPEQKARHHRLLEASLTLLDQVLLAGQVAPEALGAYARNVALELERNIRDGGRGQVDGLHAAILDWRKNRFTDTQWCELRFLVRVRQQARHGYGATQYLAALMQDPGDGRGYPGESERVIGREVSLEDVVPPWDPDFDLLATIDLDAQASEAFFGDRDRLTVDVAADGARERVRELDFSELNRAACYP